MLLFSWASLTLQVLSDTETAGTSECFLNSSAHARERTHQKGKQATFKDPGFQAAPMFLPRGTLKEASSCSIMSNTLLFYSIMSSILLLLAVLLIPHPNQISQSFWSVLYITFTFRFKWFHLFRCGQFCHVLCKMRSSLLASSVFLIA